MCVKREVKVCSHLLSERSVPSLLHQKKHLLQLLSEEGGDRGAAGQDTLSLSWQLLRYLEHHVVGEDIADVGRGRKKGEEGRDE